MHDDGADLKSLSTTSMYLFFFLDASPHLGYGVVSQWLGGWVEERGLKLTTVKSYQLAQLPHAGHCTVRIAAMLHSEENGAVFERCSHPMRVMQVKARKDNETTETPGLLVLLVEKLEGSCIWSAIGSGTNLYILRNERSENKSSISKQDSERTFPLTVK